MMLKRTLVSAAVLAAMLVPLASHAAPPDEVKLEFTTYAKAGFPEQDVFVLSAENASEVVRLAPKDAEFRSNLDKLIYASSAAQPHDIYRTGSTPLGPFPAGKALGRTMEAWLSAKGSGTYLLDDENKGTLRLRFEKLVPSGLYTVMCGRLTPPPAESVIEATCVAADGGETSFRADAEGKASYDLALKSPLNESVGDTLTVIGLDYHSDDKTCDGKLCDLGLNSHIQLIAKLPTPRETSKASCMTSAVRRKDTALRAASQTRLAAQRDALKLHQTAVKAATETYTAARKKANDDRKAAEAKAREERGAALEQARIAYDEALRNAENQDQRDLALEQRSAARDKAAGDFDVAMATALRESRLALNKAQNNFTLAKAKAKTDLDANKDMATLNAHMARRTALENFHADRSECVRQFPRAGAQLAPQAAAPLSPGQTPAQTPPPAPAPTPAPTPAPAPAPTPTY